MNICKKVRLFIVSLFTFLVSFPAKALNTVFCSKQKKASPTITLWIHGTKRFSNWLPFAPVKHFFDCQPGVHAARTLDSVYHHRKIAEILISVDPLHFGAEHFYLFGWSGKLSIEEREQAARELYQELKKLIEYYHQNYNTNPQIRIITHSHGGNVALNLAKIKSPKDKDFIIHELVLLACPVQVKTADLAQDSMFEKIYSFYSSGDMLQILDPQGLHNTGLKTPFFSERRFPESKNMVQRQIKLKGRPIMHVEFLLSPFLKQLPDLLAEAQSDSYNTNEQSAESMIRSKL